jgi:hypothetical protein
MSGAVNQRARKRFHPIQHSHSQLFASALDRMYRALIRIQMENGFV